MAKEIEGQQGTYYEECTAKKVAKEALDDEKCCELWEYSSKVLQL